MEEYNSTTTHLQRQRETRKALENGGSTGNLHGKWKLSLPLSPNPVNGVQESRPSSRSRPKSTRAPESRAMRSLRTRQGRVPPVRVRTRPKREKGQSPLSRGGWAPGSSWQWRLREDKKSELPVYIVSAGDEGVDGVGLLPLRWRKRSYVILRWTPTVEVAGDTVGPHV